MQLVFLEFPFKINSATHQKVCYSQVHKSRIDPRGCLPPPPEDKNQDSEVSNRRNHHHDAVRNNGHFMAIIKSHINR